MFQGDSVKQANLQKLDPGGYIFHMEKMPSVAIYILKSTPGSLGSQCIKKTISWRYKQLHCSADSTRGWGGVLPNSHLHVPKWLSKVTLYTLCFTHEQQNSNEFPPGNWWSSFATLWRCCWGAMRSWSWAVDHVDPGYLCKKRGWKSYPVSIGNISSRHSNKDLGHEPMSIMERHKGFWTLLRSFRLEKAGRLGGVFPRHLCWA